jgi:glycosyltransferase involved in cell wall biosynthesis
MTERVRLLCYIGSLNAGGAERQVLEILHGLDRARFAPHLLLAHRSGPWLAEVPADVPLFCCSDAAAPVAGKLARWRRWRYFAQLLRDLRIDLVYDRTYLATLDAAVACWLRPTPRMSAAVADPAVQFRLYARRPVFLWRALSRWAYHSANLVLANSEGLRRQLIAYWRLPPEQVVVQPNAVDFERLDRLAAEPCPFPPDGRFRLLTVGRIDDDKGHVDLLAALAELVQREGWRDWLWQVIGTGPRKTLLREQVAQNHLSEHVQFLGVVNNPFPYYRAADLFVLPSRTEGFPNVLLEALACGTPVIAADCDSGPRELLAHGRYGQLTPVRDPPALAAALREGRQQIERWRAAAAEGRAFVRKRFSRDRVLRQLEASMLAVLQRS